MSRALQDDGSTCRVVNVETLLDTASSIWESLTEELRVSADLLGKIVSIKTDQKHTQGGPRDGLYEVVGFSNHAVGVNAATGEHTLLLRDPECTGEAPGGAARSTLHCCPPGYAARSTPHCRRPSQPTAPPTVRTTPLNLRS